MNGAEITIVGNATRDPELRFTTGGRAVASFGVAVNRRWQQNGEWQEQVSFFNVVAWADLGENLATSITKGARVIVHGRLDQRSWETDEGEKRTVWELVATEAGPSLRWATAQIERTERTQGGDGGYHGAEQRAASGGSGYGGEGYQYSDEEPF